MARTEALARVEDMYVNGFPDAATATVDDLRAAYDALLLQFELPDGVEPAEGVAGGIPVLSVTAAGATGDKVLIWFHGGGYVLGSARGFQELGHALSAASGVTVVLPDYRRAPENKFPAAVDDGVAAIEDLISTYGAGNVAVGGDSAGGGLTLAALTVLRDKGAPLPAAAVFISPLLDFTASGASVDLYDGKDVAVSRGSIANLREAYLQGHDPQDPIASPVFGDLGGLPPSLFLVGSTEVLLDDSLRAATAISASGGAAHVSLYEDMVHVWPLFSSILPEGIEAVGEIGAYLKQAFGG
ncbi:alpha/beta hydrolase [Mycolicibacterium diernhoferi]|uniref:Alpha/beta hydrolase n=1 Tax=Mycolicibacterium diernhoferi TaxID=1801 RepID=A0A1Q4HCE6_9MYCO|nr:alpha/beta hydrolase [Mycolicibacterium diernhoferi]OJZ65112.1 alpha/beta hydrolase [Mycolicibacterium diernhoferi]OPE45826.1 alpha/beta hydrolase [Mycolicibacterium diernhoferi]PEG55040.1 alpha/beta hydrolase [Mycolicibacterium diernhoferi]QYL23676.1 alpha/beta hydrolase [Mycolicibacterium diernhoferi]